MTVLSETKYPVKLQIQKYEREINWTYQSFFLNRELYT